MSKFYPQMLLDPEKNTKTIKVVTYNIHQCIGRDGHENPMRTACLIRDLNATVIGLQELGSYHAQPDSYGTLQIDTIIKVTGMSAISGPTIYHPNSNYGNCILTNEPILAVRRHNISENGCEPRGLLDVDLEINGNRIRVMVTHLGLRSWERRNQIAKILSHLDQGPLTPTLIMGDFNEWFPWSRALFKINKRFGNSIVHATFPASFPFLALDRAWMIPQHQITKIKPVKTPESRNTSDHLPLEIFIKLCAKRS